MPDDEVRAECAEEMSEYLRSLRERYSEMAILSALTLHVSGCLNACIRAQVCSINDARIVLGRMSHDALRGFPAMDPGGNRKERRAARKKR
jgi:hypothetical protein